MLEVTNVKKEKGGSKMLTKSGKRIVSFGLALAVTGSCFAGILSDPASTQAAKKAKLKTKSMTLEVGKKKTISLTGKKSKAKYTFQASNKKIKVSKKGVVTAVKKGTAKVKVKEVYKKKTKSIGTVKVTVKDKRKQTAAPAVPTAPVVTAAPGQPSTQAPQNQPSVQPTAQPPLVTLTPPVVTEVPEPTDDPDEDPVYKQTRENSVLSTGNNARIKKAIAKARAGEEVNIGYIGGSITEGAAADPNENCYASLSAKAFGERYGVNGGENVHFVNAGMSGTPSSLGIVRYERDIVGKLGKAPDILFIEFAVNDYGECTNGGAYEGLIRRGLKSGSAVVLIFSIFKGSKTDSNRVMESSYIPYGEHYDLPMVSMGDAVKERLSEDGFTDWYYASDGMHPTNDGHKLMADCVMTMIKTIGRETAEEDNIDSANLPAPKKTDAFTDMKTIWADTDTTTLSEVESFDKGNFDGTDPAVWKYHHSGKASAFPVNFMHKATSGTAGIKAVINCKNLIIITKYTSSKSAGAAELWVDGKKVKNLTGYKSDGWNQAVPELGFSEDTAAKHEIEIKMAEGDEGKDFTVLALGYN